MKRAFLALLFVMTLPSCGSSLRMIHRGNVYFEHCHAADYDEMLRDTDLRACWAAWLEHYTDGQPPDRVDYALSRIELLDQGGRVATVEAVASRAAQVQAITRELPAGTRTRAGDEALDQGAACGGACEPGLAACMAACPQGLATCTRVCESEHRTCTNGCY